MADVTWFDRGLGYDPAVPFNALWAYIGVATANAGNSRGDARRATMSAARSEAWADYRASFDAVGGNAPDVSWSTFQSIWAQCVMVWAETSTEMRRHAIDSRPRSSWTYRSRNDTRPYRRRFVYHIQLVAAVRRGDHLTPPDRFRVTVGYSRLRATIAQATHEASIDSQDWRTSGSEIVVYAGYVTSIWEG